jgi:murein DD-endopeptidase MepM/ murein hydrolase activator NlpD
MPIQFPQDSSIPDNYESPQQQKQRLSAKGPKAGPPAPTKEVIQNRPKIADGTYRPDKGGYIGGPATAAVQLLDQVASPLATIGEAVGIKGLKQGLQDFKNVVANQEDSLLNNPVGQVYQETYKGALGGLPDAVEGIANIPSQAAQMITGKPLYQPINTGIVAENNTTAGQGLRTLSRYAFTSAIPIPGVGGVSGLGMKALGARAVEGGVQDFLGASGTTEDSTFIGNIPGLGFLQTNEKYNPIQNRAVVAFEGALMNAGFGQGAEALGRVFKWVKAGRPASGAPEAAADLKTLNNIGNTVKYGGSPDELVVPTAKFQEVQGKIDLKQEQIQALRTEVDSLNSQAKSLVQSPVPQDKQRAGDLLLESQKRLDAIAGINTEIGSLKNSLTAPQAMPTVPFTANGASGVPQPTAAPVNFKPVDMSRKNIQSINFENANGQPGFDLWFADKRFPALLPGTVKKVGKQGNRGKGYGNYIVVESIDPKTGEKVDVLYAHLADGGIKVKEGQQVVPGMQIGTQGGTGRVVSADGTIASVDFLAPASKESKSMKPYKRFNELRQELAASITGGGIKPGQMAREIPAPRTIANAVPTTQANEVIQESTQQLELLTRKQAAEAGYEVAETMPVQPRNTVNEVAAQMIRNGDDLSVENTARPGVFSITDNEIRAIGGDNANALGYAQRLAASVDYDNVKELAGTNVDIEAVRQQAREEFKSILGMDDESFDKLIAARTVTAPDGRVSVDDKGIFGLTYGLKEIASQMTDLAKMAINAEKNGMDITAFGARGIDRGLALMQLEKVANNADSWNLSRRGALRNEDQVLSKEAQKAIDGNAEKRAAIDANMKLLKEYRRAILSGDEDALAKLPAAMRAIQMVGNRPQDQLNVWRTVVSANLKNVDALHINSILSGPETQASNFNGNLFQTFGQPVLAYMAKTLPGPENKAVREEAVAAISATYDTIREFNQIIPKLWDNTATLLDTNSKVFTGYDAKLSQNMDRVKAKLDAGELDPIQASFYNVAIFFHDLWKSPFFSTLTKVMGTADQFAETLAGRQVAYRRAYLDTLALMGDAPMTEARAAKFGQVLEQQRKQQMAAIFDKDGITILDEEAKQLGDAYTFKATDADMDKITAAMITASEVPGMKLLLPFVRTPSAIFKATAKFTPGLNSVLKANSKAYKEGSDYYRAYVDGAEALGYIAATSAYVAGWSNQITGAGPLRGQERDAWLQSNRPFTIKLPGGASINYSKLEPIATVLGTFADLGMVSATWGNASVTDNFWRMFGALTSNVVNKSYLAQISTLSQMVSAGTNIKEYGKILENINSGLVPYSGLRNQTGKIVDPLIREARSSMIDYFAWFGSKKGGLGLSRNLPPDLNDVTGKPLYRDGVDGGGSYVLAALNAVAPLGVRVSKDRFRPVEKFLTEVGVDVSNSKKKILGMELTNEEMTEFTRIMTKDGKFEKALLRYFNSDEYQKLDKENAKIDISQGIKRENTAPVQKVEAIISDYTSLAKNEMSQGLTAVSAGFVERRNNALNADRQQRYQRQLAANQQRQLTANQQYEALANFSN